MDGNLYALAVEIGALVGAGALTYLVLRCMAKFNPDGCLARPHGVRDVWMMAAGQLIGFLLLFLMLYVHDFKTMRGSVFAFSVILDVFIGMLAGKMLGRLIGIKIRGRSSRSILNDTRLFTRLNRSFFVISIFLASVILAGMYFA